jgi:nicotinamide riboside transporter PnuC
VAMAMLKRLREVLMNLPGLFAWQRWERQRMPRPAG